MTNGDTLDVLKKLERGEINVNEADARLNEPSAEPAAPPKFEIPTWVRRIWIYPMILGVLTVLLGAWIIAATVNANILWLFVGLPVVLLGSLLLAITATLFSGHWLFVNIEQSRKRRRTIRFGFPFSMGLLRLGMFFAGRTKARMNIQTDRANFSAFWDKPDEFLQSIERELREGRGITIDVDDKDERVQVYIV